MMNKKTIMLTLLAITTLSIETMQQNGQPTLQNIMPFNALAIMQQSYFQNPNIDNKVMFISGVISRVMNEPLNAHFTIQDQITILTNLKNTVFGDIEILRQSGAGWSGAGWLGFLSQNKNTEHIKWLTDQITEIDKKLAELTWQAKSWQYKTGYHVATKTGGVLITTAALLYALEKSTGRDVLPEIIESIKSNAARALASSAQDAASGIDLNSSGGLASLR